MNYELTKSAFDRINQFNYDREIFNSFLNSREYSDLLNKLNIEFEK